MAFVNLLTEKTRERPLFTVKVEMDIIQSFLEEVCLKLDNLANRMTKTEEDITGKATFQDVKDFKQDVSDKVDQIILQCKQTDDKVNGMDTLLQENYKNMQEKFDSATSNCLIESGNLVRSTVESLEPELIKNVIAGMPNLDSLLQRIDANDKSINELNEKSVLLTNADSNLQAQVDALFKVSQKQGNEPSTTELHAELQRVTSNLSFQKSAASAATSQETFDLREDFQLQFNQINDKLKKMNEEIEDTRNYTNKQISAVQELLSPQIRELDNQINDLRTDMSNKTRDIPSSRQVDLPPDLMDKINKLGGEITKLNDDIISMKERLNDNTSALKILSENFTNPPAAVSAPANIEIKDDGSFDATGLTNSVQFLTNNFRVLASRLDVLESKKYVTPETLTATREIANKCVDRLNALDTTIAEMKGELLSKVDSDLMQLRDDTSKDIRDVKEAANTSREIATIASRNGDETLRLLQKTRTEMSDMNTKIAELSIPKPNPAVEKLSSTVSGIQTYINNIKDVIVKVGSEADAANTRSKSNETSVNQIMTRIDELTKEISEKEKELSIPKVEFVQQRKTVVRAQAPEPAPVSDDSPRRPGSVLLPKIARQTVDDGKLDAALGKVTAQDGIIQGMRKQIDQLVKGYQNIDDVKADKQSCQALFEQFRVAMVELNSRLMTLRRSVIGKADLSEVKNMLTLATTVQTKDTAGGVEPVRCICCGRPATGVTGSINESLDNRKTPPISSRAISDADGQVCFVYGDRGDMFYGRSGDGRSRFSAKTDVTLKETSSSRK